MSDAEANSGTNPLAGPRSRAELVPSVSLPAVVAAEVEVLRSAPRLARVAAASSWRLASWATRTAAAGTSLVIRHAASGDPPQTVVQNIALDLRSAAWHALGLNEDTDPHGVPESIAPVNSTVEDLRARGRDLIRRSNDVHIADDTHPAFARILAELTPDEARILRYLYNEGAQPAIDVRTNRPFGIGSELVADGLNMIAEFAGCRNPDRIHPYLTNLGRLGLLEFSKEQVSNPQHYQLLEAQPKVTAVLRRAGRWPRTVRRSIALNAFGEEFCRTCLPLGGYPSPGAMSDVSAAPRVDAVAPESDGPTVVRAEVIAPKR
ncbi:MAG TPA: Abi-alpha family protein [Jatrophihabitantaceae bacterium]